MSRTDGKGVQNGEPMVDSTRRADIGLVAALSIGVGGMIGAGIFSILGVVARISGSAMPLSFAIGGVVAGLAAYSYVALGKAFPSVGGAVTFLVRGYGEGVAAGSLNPSSAVSGHMRTVSGLESQCFWALGSAEV
jgi:amino acid transporter